MQILSQKGLTNNKYFSILYLTKGKENKTMTTWYRLVYRNGHKGAWTTDLKRIVKDADFFGARIETKTC